MTNYEHIKGTFGQRLKSLRKSKDMSQSELAEKLGVSIQTVSRWECDTGMPDIVQIVPLAKELGATTDMLLGMDTSETDDVEAFDIEMEEFWDKTSWNNPNEGERYEDKIFETYKKCRELYRRYPTNFDLTLRCSYFGVQTLETALVYHRLVLDERDVKSVMIETERMLKSVINYDIRLDKKIEAKKMLISLYCFFGEYDKAYAECDSLGYTDALEAKEDIAKIRDEEEDREDMITFAKEMLAVRISELYNAFYDLGRAYSVFGHPKRGEAISVYEKADRVFEAVGKDVAPRTRIYAANSMYMLLAKEYIREGDVDRCLDYVEKVTETCIDYFNDYKKYLTDGIPDTVFHTGEEPGKKEAAEFVSLLEKEKRDLMWMIVACWEECGSEDNPVTSSDRYKKCMEKYNKEMVCEI